MFSLAKGILSLLWLVLTIGVLLSIWRHETKDSLSKILWTIFVFIANPIAVILWLVWGNKK